MKQHITGDRQNLSSFDFDFLFFYIQNSQYFNSFTEGLRFLGLIDIMELPWGRFHSYT